MANETPGGLGPISYLIVEFPGNKMTGEGFATLLDFVDRGVIRILDLKFVTRHPDGSMRALELEDIGHDGQFDLAVFAGASSGLLAESDLSESASVIEPGSSAGILIFENRWATPFVQALRHGEAQLVAAGYISQEDLVAALDAAPKADRKQKGKGHAPTPRSRTDRSHRWNSHCCLEPSLTPAAESVGTTRGAAILATTAIRSRAPTAAPAPDPIAQLKDLADLKAQGVLTEAEFEAQKAKVLAS